MVKRLTMFLAALLLTAAGAMAQTQVNGTVVSQEDGEPVVGATVLVVGTQVGAATDINGRFSLTCPKGKNMLRISYVGMEPIEVSARPNMRIVLTSDSKALDEVMVVAFGTAKKSAFTGSAAVINSEDLAKKTTANVANALVGSVPGLQMTGQSGAPGAGNGSMYVRGLSSLYSSVDPLIIVDGAPYYASLTNIATDDIESVTVLKDAASAALYGAAGAAGVILVTTKKGKTQEAVVNVDMRWGANTRAVQDYETIQDPALYYETYYAMMNNYYVNQGYSKVEANAAANSQTLTRLGYNIYTVPTGQNLIGTNGKLNPNATLGRTYTATNGETYYMTNDDWTDAAYSTAFRQEYTVNISAGGPRSSFYASAGYLNEDGIIEYSGYERFTTRLKADYQAKKWLKVSANIGYTHSDQDNNPNMSTTWNATNLMYATSYIAPIYPIYVRVIDPTTGKPVIRTDEYGHPQYDYGVASYNYLNQPNRGFMSTSNPLGSNRYNTQNSIGNQLNQTYTADITFTDYLKFTSTNNVNLGQTTYTSYENPFEGPTKADNGGLTKYQSNSLRQDYIQTLNFHKLFGGVHDVQVMLGHEWNKTSTKYLSAYARNGFSAEVKEINNFGDRYDSYSYTTEFNREGYFANAMYNYAEKYFGQVAYRRDASSYFDKDHRWGNFWSVGAAWILSKENFLADTKGWLDQLKLKASLGQQGNDGIGAWAYTNLYSLSRSGTDIVPTFYRLGNSEITWETTTNLNVGLEWSLWRGRLTGSLDFYNKKTSDLLFWLNIPESYGTRGYYSNIGDIRNRGVELELKGDIVRSKNIVWNVGLNLSHNKAKILKLPESKTIENGGFAATSDFGSIYSWYEEGGDMNNAFLYKYAGIYNENTWQLTNDTEYDPSKAGLAMYWGDSDLLEDGTMNTSKPAKNQSYATTTTSDASRYALGSTLPKLTGGFSTTVKIYDFDLSATFDFQLGGKVFDSSYQSLMSPESGSSVSARTWHKDILDSWTATNTGTDIPRFQYNDDYTAASSDRFMTSAKYLNFQSFSVGYTIPRTLISKLYLNKVRVYVQGQNLCFWSVRRGFDPRYSFGSTASTNVYSPVRTISGGVQVTF